MDNNVQETKCNLPEHADMELGTPTPLKKLDLVFGMDCTGSMGSYIDAAKQDIESIVTKLIQGEKCDFRFGLVAYRDHPPQDSSYVTRVFDFCTSLRQMHSYLKQLSAQGGGDGPEAVTAALHELNNMPWRADATKVVVLISDAPPHGLGEAGDGFPNGDPNNRDPLEIARDMASKGITIYPVGCEPALGSYRYARAFMISLARITDGQAVSLASSALLADVIVGGAAEEMDLELLVEETRQKMENIVKSSSQPVSDDEIAQQIHSAYAGRGLKSKQMRVDAVMSDAMEGYIEKCDNLSAAREMLSKQAPQPRSDLLCDDYYDPGAAPESLFSFGACAAAPPAPMAARRGMRSEPISASRCDVVEDSISYEQVQRLVNKSKKRSY